MACTTSLIEIVDNSIDEAMAGRCDRIWIHIAKDGRVTVRDNGWGIPVDKHAGTGKSALETVMTVLHAGGKFGGGAYKVSGGLHGVGASVVNALSEDMWVEVRRGGKLYRQEYERGMPHDEVQSRQGVLVRRARTPATALRPARRAPSSPTTRSSRTSTSTPRILLQRFREYAYLTKGIWLSLHRRAHRHSRSPSTSRAASRASCAT